MKDTDKLIASSDPEDVTGCIPDDIKVHSDNKANIVPDSIKHCPDNSAVCRIVPEGKGSEFGSDIGLNGVSHNGDKIRIVPDSKKINGKLFT
ncbi:MAG: hypothetical protein ACI4JN_00530 [Ruminococcus sp.]